MDKAEIDYSARYYCTVKGITKQNVVVARFGTRYKHKINVWPTATF